MAALVHGTMRLRFCLVGGWFRQKCSPTVINEHSLHKERGQSHASSFCNNTTSGMKKIRGRSQQLYCNTADNTLDEHLVIEQTPTNECILKLKVAETL